MNDPDDQAAALPRYSLIADCRLKTTARSSPFFNPQSAIVNLRLLLTRHSSPIVYGSRLLSSVGSLTDDGSPAGYTARPSLVESFHGIPVIEPFGEIATWLPVLVLCNLKPVLLLQAPCIPALTALCNPQVAVNPLLQWSMDRS